MDKNNVGNNVKEMRKAVNLTQEELADLTGVSTVHVSHVETGKSGISVQFILELCRILSVTPNDVLSGEYGEPEVNINAQNFFETSPYIKDGDREIICCIMDVMKKRNSQL